MIKNGLRWSDAPAGYGPHKTIYNRFIRWSRLGVFNRIFEALAAKGDRSDQLMIDAKHLEAHRPAVNLLKKSCSPPYRTHQGRAEFQAARGLRRTRSPARHAAERGADEDYKGAALILPVLPRIKVLLGDKGYDADWLRQALAERRIKACVVSTPDTIDARTPLCPPSQSPLSSSSSFDQ